MGRIVANTNTLPILNNLLLKTENGILKISSTNLEIAITTNIRCKVEEDGVVTVASKIFVDLVNNLPNKNIIIQTKEGDLQLETENYHTKIKTLSAEDFPLIPKIENNKSLIINSQELKNTFDLVVFAASSNQTQPEISGVFFGQTPQGIRIAATDRYRLAEKKILLSSTEENNYEYIIPQKTVLEISRIIGNQNIDVSIVFGETQIVVDINETQIISRLIDGQYPDYKQIIPNVFPTSLITEKTLLANALKAVAVFSQGSSSVKLEINSLKQQILLTTESSELGKSEVELPAKIEGGSTSMVLNYHYLLDCLSGITTKNIELKANNDSSPGLIVPEGDDSYLYLVMPIKS